MLYLFFTQAVGGIVPISTSTSTDQTVSENNSYLLKEAARNIEGLYCHLNAYGRFTELQMFKLSTLEQSQPKWYSQLPLYLRRCDGNTQIPFRESPNLGPFFSHYYDHIRGVVLDVWKFNNQATSLLEVISSVLGSENLVLECRTAVMLATLMLISICTSSDVQADLLQRGREEGSESLSDINVFYLNEIDITSENSLQIGDIVAVPGHPEYLVRHRCGIAMVENVMVIGYNENGDPLLVGFGDNFKDGAKTLEKIRCGLLENFAMPLNQNDVRRVQERQLSVKTEALTQEEKRAAWDTIQAQPLYVSRLKEEFFKTRDL